MERRKALTFAGVTTATVAAGIFALAANFGLLSTASADTDVGELDAGDVEELLATRTTTEPETPDDPEIIVIDEYVTDPAPAAGYAPSNVGQPAPAPSYESEYEDDDHDGYDDDECEDDEYDDDHEDDEHEDDECEDDHEHEEEEHEDDEEHDGDDDDD